MSTEKDAPSERDERRLQALFDETAAQPEPDALRRMARAAAQIPDLQQPWYRKLWSPQPLAIGAVIAAAALALVITMGDDDGAPVGPRVETTQTTTVTAPTPSAPDDDALDELLAFDLTDNGDEELASLDADPLASWEGGDDDSLVDDHPMTALDVLFVEGDDDIEMLGNIFDDMLTEGG